MQDFPETRHSLLVRVQQDDRDAWDEFSQIYRPVVYRLARRRGWQDADAQDVAQKVLLKVAAAIPAFRPDDSRAKFRTWLTTVCRNTLVDELRRSKSIGVPHNEAVIEELDMKAVQITDEELLLEQRRQVFRWAALQARRAFAESTWRAFWLTTIEAVPVRATAARLEMSSGSVYTARSRVMQFMKQKVQEYDDGEL